MNAATDLIAEWVSQFEVKRQPVTSHPNETMASGLNLLNQG
jgi:hypothetical protein